SYLFSIIAFAWPLCFKRTTINQPIKAPDTLLTKNDGKKKNIPNDVPINNVAKGIDANDPKIPVPMISPITAALCRFHFLYKEPAKNAPIIPPGKAKIDPNPSIFRIKPMMNAMITAGPGPSKIPATTLTACWTGYALAKPAGNHKNCEPIIPIATKTAIVVISRVRFIFYYTSLYDKITIKKTTPRRRNVALDCF